MDFVIFHISLKIWLALLAMYQVFLSTAEIVDKWLAPYSLVHLTEIQISLIYFFF